MLRDFFMAIQLPPPLLPQPFLSELGKLIKESDDEEACVEALGHTGQPLSA